jgi:hypothetical protein
MDLRPGQIEPNELEQAILARLARQEASLAPLLGRLHVLSREFTGVGSFTSFRCDASEAIETTAPLELEAEIRLPGVAHGMGALLFFEGDQPSMLELYTYGELWDGVYAGFSIEEAP